MIWQIIKSGKECLLHELREGTVLGIGSDIVLVDDAGCPHTGTISYIGEYYFKTFDEQDIPWSPAAISEVIRAARSKSIAKKPLAAEKPSPKTEERGNSKTAQHYIDARLEPIEVMQRLMTAEEFRGFLKGNVIKYRLRAGHKEATEKDITKANQYQHWLDLVAADPTRRIGPIKDSL